MLYRKLLSKTMLALTAGTLFSTAALAQQYDTRPNVYGGALYQFFDNDFTQDDDFGWVVGGEIPVAERWGATLEYWNVETDHDAGTNDAELKYYRVGGNYHLTQRGLWQPYLSAGLGYYRIQESYPVSGDDEGSFDFGVGVKRFIGEHLFIRGDAKLLRVQELKNWDQTVSVGIGYAFGPRSAAPAPAPVAAAPAVAPQPAPDSDGDGVPDARDNCLNTARNLAVDANGCPVLETSMMRQQLLVNFDFDQAEIKPEFYDEITEFADFLKMYANTNAIIEGHTDADGAEAYNQQLSERRATAVMNRLVNTHGIPASRLSAVGYGESRPVVDNNSAANKLRNRRIEADVSAQIQQPRAR